jgi:5-(carboxyamino)imidazole ribonucleotide mutase
MSVRVAILMGSRSDLDAMAEACRLLEDFGIEFEAQALSAHRTPERVAEYVEGLEERGVQVLICGAGGAAHLAGVAASHTLIPVIGVPMKSGLNGLDSLLATVQMPRGIPVATTAIGGSGAYNAALLAVQIMSLSDPELHERYAAFRKSQTQAVLDKSALGPEDWAK